nr:hypothetical protein [uncultured Cohaesibacter sp.]
MKSASLTLGFLLVSTALVHAQSDAETAWEAIVKDLNHSGLVTAKAGSVHYNEADDRFIVQNLTYELSFTLPNFENSTEPAASTQTDDASQSQKQETSIMASVSMPDVAFTGLKLKDAGFSFDSMQFDSMKIDMTIDVAGSQNDSRMEIKTLGPNVITKGYQPFLKEFKIAPSRPIGSTLDYLRPILMQSAYEKISGEGLSIKQFLKDSEQPIQTTEIGPLSVEDYQNGGFGSYEVAYQKSNIKLDERLAAASEETSLTDKAPLNMSYQIDKVRYEGYDLSALWSALDPNAPAIEGKKPLLKKAEMQGATLNIPGLADVTFGPSVQSDILVSQPASHVVPLLDKMIAKDLEFDDLSQDDQQAFVKAGFDLAKSFSMGLTLVGKTNATITIPEGAFIGQEAKFGFDEIRQAGFSNNGIGESSISGITYDGPPSINFKLGRFALEDLEFADYDLIEKAIFDSMNDMPPEGSDAAKLGPNALTIGLSDLLYKDGNGHGLSADQAKISYDRQGLAIPAKLSTKIDNLKISKTMLQHPLAVVFLDQLGLDDLTINEELSMNWDSDKQTYVIDPLNLAFPGIASLSGSLGAGGIMKDYLSKPETANAIMATASVLPASLTLKDLGGLNELINLAGGATGMGPEQIRSTAALQLKAMMSAFTEPEFADSVASEVDRFMKDPKSLAVTMSPSAPVPLAQLLGVAVTAPQQIPYILALSVIANND